MSETGVKRKGAVLKAILAPLLVGTVGFAAKGVMQEYSSYHEDREATRRRLESLENDRSKWATLAELHNKVEALGDKSAVNANDIQWVKWVLRHRPDAAGSAVGAPPKTPAVELPPDLPPMPPPQQMQKPVDPDRFRELQQRKYGSKGE